MKHALFRSVLVLAVAVGCDGPKDARSDARDTGTVVPALRAEPASPAPQSPGAWRSAGPQLSRVVLWPAHILVRYAGVKNATDVSFSMADFHSVPAAPTRTRDEALALARDVQRRARAEPQRFAELARESSEDIVRREQGGSLGGLPAGQLKPWPEVLDALFAISPGQISDVVETEYGFHVFTRHAPPAAATLTGRRLVVGHDDARWLAQVEAAPPPRRSREQARQLIERIHEAARRDPDSFPALVTEHSELRDRVLGGDLGTWSSVEPSPFPRELELLAQLPIGGVSPPFDSIFGWQIVQRVPDRERADYALEGAAILFDRDAPDSSPRSPAQALLRARELTKRLLATPASLPELVRDAGIVPASGQWTEGRGAPEIMAALAAVSVDQVIPEPVRSASRYVVGRRIAPRPRVTEPALFELPD